MYIRINDEDEKALLIRLLNEFGTRVIRTRGEQKPQDLGHYAITEIRDDEFSDEKLYKVALPEHYIMFIIYLLEKTRWSL